MSYMTMGDEIHALRCDRAAILQELEQVKAERDALAAHVDAACQITAHWIENEQTTANVWELARKIGRWSLSAPETSLALHDAGVIASLRFPTMLRQMWSGGDVQRWLDEQAEEKRRQAAEGHNEGE